MATGDVEIPEHDLHAMVDGALPPFPEIVSVLAGLPDQSEPIVLAQSGDRLLLWANSDNSSKNAYVSEVPNQRNPISDAVIANFWDGTTIPNYVLTLRRYWQQVPGAYTLVQAGGGFEQTYTTTTGISETDSETLSAELGVSGGGLSAKISASFTHSVTTSLATSQSRKFTAGAPASGFQRVWVLWQLVDELVALTPSGDVIPTYIGEADVTWFVDVPMMGTSGAFMNYQNARQTFPTQTLMPQQKDFPL
ncbi:MAG: hypothetical protein ACJ8EB_00545 [Allosphingosinicella sp.]